MNKKTNQCKWYDVTITESYHHTYKILAIDKDNANDIADALANCGRIDPTADGSFHYNREIDVNDANKPNDDEMYFSNDDVE